MHMADALLSPAVGGAMWAATAGVLACCARRVKRQLDDSTVPLMGVLGAFVFAAQMINFTIPATGSSGHLGGGLLLAILLGPCAAFLTTASVVTVQALFFADGGLLALGCNIFNLGAFPCFVAWPIYRRLAGAAPSVWRIAAGALAGAVIALQFGASAVVLQTLLSGMAAIPPRPFFYLMQSTHLGIGIAEGMITAVVTLFIWRARPQILAAASAGRPLGPLPMRKVLAGLGAAAVLTGGGLSWFASAHPDGLEWSLLQATGQERPAPPAHGIHPWFARIQDRFALLPDYTFREGEGVGTADAGTPVAGLLGGAITLLLTGTVGVVLHRRGKARRGG